MNADELPVEVLVVLCVLARSVYGIVRYVQRVRRIAREQAALFDDAGRTGTAGELVPGGHDGGSPCETRPLGTIGTESGHDRVPDDVPKDQHANRKRGAPADHVKDDAFSHARMIPRLYDSARPGGPIPSIIERLDRWPWEGR